MKTGLARPPVFPVIPVKNCKFLLYFWNWGNYLIFSQKSPIFPVYHVQYLLYFCQCLLYFCSNFPVIPVFFQTKGQCQACEDDNFNWHTKKISSQNGSPEKFFREKGFFVLTEKRALFQCLHAIHTVLMETVHLRSQVSFSLFFQCIQFSQQYRYAEM